MKKVSVLLVFLLGFVVFPVTVFAASSPSVSYQTNVQSQGWQSWKTNAQTSGTTGKGKRLEAIKIKTTNEKYKGSIEYKTSIQKQGWENLLEKMVRYLVQAVRGNVWKRSKSNLPVRSLSIMMSIIESMHNNLAGWAGQKTGSPQELLALAFNWKQFRLSW